MPLELVPRDLVPSVVRRVLSVAVPLEGQLALRPGGAPALDAVPLVAARVRGEPGQVEPAVVAPAVTGPAATGWAQQGSAQAAALLMRAVLARLPSMPQRRVALRPLSRRAVETIYARNWRSVPSGRSGRSPYQEQHSAWRKQGS